MDIQTNAKPRQSLPLTGPVSVHHNSLCGRLIDLVKHLRHEGHMSPLDEQLVLTLVHHPQMHPHLKEEDSRPSYTMSRDYDGTVGEYLA